MSTQTKEIIKDKTLDVLAHITAIFIILLVILFICSAESIVDIIYNLLFL